MFKKLESVVPRFAGLGALRGLMTALVALLLIGAPSLSLGEAGAPHVMERGAFRLPSGSIAGDVVVSGPVWIAGKVQGSVFVISGDVTLETGGEVTGNVTVIGNDLKLKTGSTVHGSVAVIGGRLIKENGAVVQGSIEEKREQPSFDSRQLLWKYMVFERPVLPGDSPEESLNGLNRVLIGWKSDTPVAWNGPAPDGLPAVQLPPGSQPSARIASYKRIHNRVNIGIANFTSPAESDAFWDSILKAWPEDKMSRSVLVTLGGGAHWFFLYGEHSVAIWVSDTQVVMVEAILEDSHEALPMYLELVRDNVVQSLVHQWRRRNHHR